MIARNTTNGMLRLVASLLALSIAAHAAAAPSARQIYQATGVNGGLVVHLGCGDGKLTAALRAGDGYLVHGLDADAADVATARDHIRGLGLYGRVSVDRLTGPRLPYADHLVNLVVSEGPGEVPTAEVMRVLCPGGVAYLKKDGEWAATVKPRPARIDEWTHYLHGPDNNAVAKDTVAGPPRRLQWVCGPRWARSHDHLSTVSAMVSAGGRVFYIVDEGSIASVALPPKWALVARDAFNGVRLWKRPIAPWEGHLRGFRSGPTELARRLVAVGDRVYVTLGYGKGVTALDAATGRPVRTYPGTENTLEIVCCDGVLLLVVGDRPPDNTAGAAKPVNPRNIWHWWAVYPERPPRKRLVAIRADSGKLLWKKADDDTKQMLPTTLASAGGRVFFQSPKELIALAGSSGRPIWRTDRPAARQRATWSAPTLVVHGDVVLSGDRAADAKAPGAPQSEADGRWVVNSLGGNAPPGELIAYDAATGRKLWSSPVRECYNAPPDVLVADGLVWTGSLVSARDPGVTVGRDVRTGQIRRRRTKDQDHFRIGMGHHRCYRNKATDRYLVLGRDGIELIDLATGAGQAHPWVRGSCQYGVMPCNGLVYAPPHSCACHIESKLNGFNALAPAADASAGRPASTAPRLERGPAYGAGDPQSAIRNPPPPRLRRTGPQSEDWPTFRGDPARHGSARTTVAAAVGPAWQKELGGKLSALTVAEGKVFVASVDTHTVHALDAADGKEVWRFTAGGRVDSPPTIQGGLALFGSADGWVYCLRAADGALAWRFRAAPHDRRVVSYGQVESAWPLHGSVLVEDAAAYVAAGRSSFLDGGIHLYRLDAATGKVLSQTRIDGRHGGGGALPDVLAADGASVYLRHRRFAKDLTAQRPTAAHMYSPAGLLDGSWWHRTYWLVGTGVGSGWGAWPNAALRNPAGRLLVVDGPSVYGFGRLNQYHRHGTHAGLGRTRYRLFACDRAPKPAAKPTPAGARPGSKARPAKRRRGGPGNAKIQVRWQREVPLYVRAMVLAGRTLFVAGPPDLLDKAVTDSTDPYHTVSESTLADQDAAFAGHRRGVLWAVGAADGKQLSECKLAAPPVFDGLAAAGGRLLMATTDGKVICFGPR